MSHPTLGIDHCYALVSDLEASADQYRRLGFTLSARGLHSEAKGTANYTIMFPDDYFELMGVLHDTPDNAPRRALLEQTGEGLYAIACRIEDAHAGADALAALGIETGRASDFERPVELSDGTTGRAAFATLDYAPGEVPRGIVFMCQHKTPDTVWLPELLSHPNGACGIAAIVALSDDPAVEGAGFSRLWRDGKVTQTDSETRIETGENSAPLILMTLAQITVAYPTLRLSDTANGAFAILRLKTTQPLVARHLIESNGVRVHETAAGFAIPALSASGCILEFVPD